MHVLTTIIDEACDSNVYRSVELDGLRVHLDDSQHLAGTIEEFSGKMHDRSVIQALAEMTEAYSPQRSAEALIAATETSVRDARARGSWKGWRR